MSCARGGTGEERDDDRRPLKRHAAGKKGYFPIEIFENEMTMWIQLYVCVQTDAQSPETSRIRRRSTGSQEKRKKIATPWVRFVHS